MFVKIGPVANVQVLVIPATVHDEVVTKFKPTAVFGMTRVKEESALVACK